LIEINGLGIGGGDCSQFCPQKMWETGAKLPAYQPDVDVLHFSSPSQC
jgi:hypothetical protein